MLYPKQKVVARAALSGRYREVWAYGAVRSGKTYGLAVPFFRLCLARPGKHFLIGVSQEAITNNQIPYLRDLGRLYRVPITENRGRLTIGGSTVRLRALADRGSHQALMGDTALTAWYDETGRLDKEAFDESLSRLSAPKAVALCSLNPESPAHWTTEYIKDAESRGGKAQHFVLDDNETLDSGYKDYIKKRYHAVPHLYSRYIDGAFAAAEGLVYPRVVYDEGPLDDSVTLLVIDPGPGSVYCGLYARRTVSGDAWVVFDMYYWDAAKRGPLGEREHVEQMVRRNGPPWVAVYDSASASLQTELRRAGVYGIPARKDVWDGILVTNQRLVEGVLRLRPGLVALETERAGYEWDKRGQDQGVDRPVKRRDHAMDCLRYLAQTPGIW